MNNIENERKFLSNLLDEEDDENIMKAIFIDYLKKSQTLSEREQFFEKLSSFQTKKKVDDIRGFIKDIFLHDTDRIKIEEEGGEKKIGWYIEKIMNNLPEDSLFMVDLVYTYLTTIRHQDSAFLIQQLQAKKYGLPDKVRVELLKKLKVETIVRPSKQKKIALISFKDFLNDFLILSSQSSSRETTIFREFSHGKLCEAFKNYLSGLIKKSPEPFTAQILHAPNDKGVDILIELQKTNQKFGIQVKAYTDIKSKDFSKIVKSNISESKQHGLEKFYIAFCGDLSYQRKKIRMITSEISQMNYPYVIPISPAQCCYILQPYLKK